MEHIDIFNASAIAYKRPIETFVLPFSISDKYALSIPTITAKSICNRFCSLRCWRMFEPMICNLLLNVYLPLNIIDVKN